MGKLNLEIITPERIAYQEKVDMVVVPGKRGMMGILPNHIPLFAELVEGEVKIKRSNDEIYLAIGGGFIEVTKGKVIILVTRAVHYEQLNEQEILEAKERAEKILDEKPEGEDLEAAQRLLRSSLVDLKILQRRRKKRPVSVSA